MSGGGRSVSVCLERFGGECRSFLSGRISSLAAEGQCGGAGAGSGL